MSAYSREEIGGLVLVGRMLAREGKRDELLQLLDETVALCAEYETDGALTATFHISPANPDLVVLYEHYPSRASLTEHQANYQRIPAYGEMRARMNEFLAAPIEVVEVVKPVVRFAREALVDSGETRRS
jgi:quinol monooxygenase YgiN